ncbi:hypothetical protein CPB86DRAFT_815430 [Serendipita vermifera]|nr:hypothetical protein CPB86DRAFT_815430 [Serendipita vermifera]
MADGDITLWLQIVGEWVPVLCIPREVVMNFTTWPVRWILYLGFALYGRKGILTEGPNSGEVKDYELDGVNCLKMHYFYYSEEPHALLDPDVLNNRLSSVQAGPAEGRSLLSKAVRRRDAKCPVTGLGSRSCDAVHIVPHAKGSDYIRLLSEFRGDGSQPILHDIDDYRNGFLLSKLLHSLFDHSELGFLRTPNFALRRDDVPATNHSNALAQRAGSGISKTSTTLTLQYFCRDYQTDHLQSMHAANNKDLKATWRQSSQPCDFLLDMAYGAIALKHWGLKEARTKTQKVVSHIYYPPQQDLAIARAQWHQIQCQARATRAKERSNRCQGN